MEQVKQKEGGILKINQEWICCPICGSKTRIRVREDTVLENFPLYCPKCKLESLIEVKKIKVKYSIIEL